MRLSRFSPWFAAFAGCLASAFLACGSDVEEVPFESSSSSSSGAGAAGSTSTAAGGSSTSTSGPSASSVAASTAASTSGTGGTGGVGTPCEEACEKVEGRCGFPGVCGQFVDCGMAGADCFGQCVLDADCDAIASLVGANPDPTLLACVTGCQQGGQGGAGGGGVGGGGVGGGPAGDCIQCGQSACLGDALACIQNPQCSDWIQCVQACNGDPACSAVCEQSNPGGPASDDLKECACMNCSAECSALLTCN